MPYPVIHRFARIAPRKARLVADMIRGMPIDRAMTALQFSKKRAAWYMKSILKSAIANAEEANADLSTLVVSESRIDVGPVIKRFQPKDRGRAFSIMKRTSHILIVLDQKA
jgi:large subunit ribosomal protein L22